MTDQQPAPTVQQGTSTGFGRLLVAIYALFALSATARVSVQALRAFDEAPVAYMLSGIAAVLYVVATISLAQGTRSARRIAWAAVIIEMVGVLAVGAFSYMRPELFSHATVWSHFGQGYGFVPLVLPALGLWWLARTRPRNFLSA